MLLSYGFSLFRIHHTDQAGSSTRFPVIPGSFFLTAIKLPDPGLSVKAFCTTRDVLKDLNPAFSNAYFLIADPMRNFLCKCIYISRGL
jgi:hypothetical protein